MGVVRRDEEILDSLGEIMSEEEKKTFKVSVIIVVDNVNSQLILSLVWRTLSEAFNEFLVRHSFIFKNLILLSL